MRSYIGRPLKRREDHELLLGKATFVADLRLQNMLEAAFVRSPFAHAKILNLRVDEAVSLPGVHCVMTSFDLPLNDRRIPGATNVAGTHVVTDPILADSETRYVGEPVAVVLAETRYVAEDAADLVDIDYEPLPACTDLRTALLPGAPLVHDRLGSNLAGETECDVGDVQASFTQADHVLHETFEVHRGSSNPLEARGIVAVPAGNAAGSFAIEIFSSTQSPYRIRDAIAPLLGIPPDRIRVKACSVGGGFGPKSGVYPEDFVIPWLALRAGVPVKWIEDRREHLLCARQERDQVHNVSVAFAKSGKILALRDEFVHDVGAYSTTVISPWTTAYTIPGPYKIKNLHVHMKLAFTNKVPTMTVRGAGRPQAVFVMERVVDRVAGILDIDPAEVRRRNFLTDADLPWSTGLTTRDGDTITYERGDFSDAFEQVMIALDYSRLRSRIEAENKFTKRKKGIGIAAYLITTGRGPFELAKIAVDARAKISLYAGTCPQGQGHQTFLAQICAEELGVDPEAVTVSTGDTLTIPRGFGTFASRSAVTAGNAVTMAAARLREVIRDIAANLLRCSSDEIIWENGRFLCPTEDRRLMLSEIVEFITERCERTAQVSPFPVEVEGRFEVPGHTFAGGAHGAVVEVDTETGLVALLQYVAAHDCGTIINPTIVRGQIIGGVAHGIGTSLLERVAYDKNGLVLSSTFKDYLLPLVTDVCPIQVLTLESPSPKNPLGVKGVGESGAVGAPAAIIAAVEHSLRSMELKINSFPISPEKLLGLIRRVSRPSH